MRCRKWSIPPQSGGLDSQPLEIVQMEYLLNIYDTFYSHYSTEDRAKWNESNPAGVQLIYDIEKQMIEDA